MKFYQMIILISFYLGHSFSFADKPKLKVAYIDFPPFYSQDSKGHAQGFLSDRVAAITKVAGYDIEMNMRPAKRMIHEIVQGDLDVWMGASGFPEFKDTTYIGNNIFTTLELKVYSLNNISQIQKKEDLRGKKVILMSGYSYGGWISFLQDPANKISITEARSTDQALRLLRSKSRGDILLHYSTPVEYELNKNPIADLQSSLLTKVETHIVVSKKNPDSENILKKLEEALLQIDQK